MAKQYDVYPEGEHTIVVLEYKGEIDVYLCSEKHPSTIFGLNPYVLPIKCTVLYINLCIDTAAFYGGTDLARALRPLPL